MHRVLDDYLRAHAQEGIVLRQSASHLRLRSQIWRGIEWEHDLCLVQPDSPRDMCILEITGGEIHPLDQERADVLCQTSGLPVATLYQIPHQPIWDMVEDDLIAHTFEQYILGGEDDWPLLLPMTRSVIAAMDALPFERFLVTGASKRGWTTYLAAATGDPRIVGIAPRVFDHLNMPTQLHHQEEIWGGYSPRIDDYTRRGIQACLETERGQNLTQIVDPFTYRSALTMPLYSVNGANDGYWALDAADQYWGALDCPRWMVHEPNELHGFGDPALASPSLASFAQCVATGDLPDTPKFDWAEGSITCSNDFELWTAQASGNWVADSEWSRVGTFSAGQMAPVGAPGTAALALVNLATAHGVMRVSATRLF